MSVSFLGLYSVQTNLHDLWLCMWRCICSLYVIQFKLVLSGTDTSANSGRKKLQGRRYDKLDSYPLDIREMYVTIYSSHGFIQNLPLWFRGVGGGWYALPLIFEFRSSQIAIWDQTSNTFWAVMVFHVIGAYITCMTVSSCHCFVRQWTEFTTEP